jgi:hypothetical protein
MSTRKPKILTRSNAASPNEFLHYARSLPMRHLCRTLGRHERTVKDWMNGKAVIPPWAVAVLRLQALEYELMRDQMGFTAIEREARRHDDIPARLLTPPANEALYASPLAPAAQPADAAPRVRIDSTYVGHGK